MNFHYSQDHFPPAPIIDITLSTAAESLQVGPLPAFVDSGADGTIVPIDYLDEIQAPPTVETFIRSQWRERYSVMLYLVDIQIGTLTLPGIEVVGDEHPMKLFWGVMSSIVCGCCWMDLEKL